MCEKILNYYGCENWRTILAYRLTEISRLMDKVIRFSIPYLLYALAIYGISLIAQKRGTLSSF